jgi:HK97 family phage major capsid protein
MATINELAPNTAPTNGQGGDHQGRLAHLPSDLLPKNLVGAIFEKAQESSLVLRLGQSIPVTYGETVIPVNTKRPEVGQVGGTTNESREGERKPISGVGWGSRSFSPIKLATIVTASEEFVRTNPSGLFTQMQGDLAYAIGRGIDLAVFHGKQPLNGAALAGIDADNVLANTTNELFLDEPNADLFEQLLAGYDLASANTDNEFSAWAADSRMRSRLARAMVVRDTNGNVANPGAVNLSADAGSLAGFPVYYGKAVGGDLGAAADSGVRILGGDFSQLRYGYADQVRVKVTDQATLTDGTQTISMWQTNQVAILIEVTFGWVVGDLDAFVKYNATGYTAG